MILIPYFFSKTSNGEWYNVGLFLCDGGKTLWSEEGMTDTEIQTMLLENGFPIMEYGLLRRNGICFAEVSILQMNFSDFYSWEDDIVQNDLWRTLQIPCSLWKCPIFQHEFCKESKIPRIHDVLSWIIDKK